ncbi:MAG: hypothetical protein K2W95_05755 [Candidatus Obscuribacterales bacterium]|nr:hypothetical protein [Candidatus Obscuribacterales bacterium]
MSSRQYAAQKILINLTMGELQEGLIGIVAPLLVPTEGGAGVAAPLARVLYRPSVV